MAATDRLHGKNGAIKMDPTGGSSLVAVAPGRRRAGQPMVTP